MTEMILSSQGRIPIWETPAGVYLSGLSTGSRQTMTFALLSILKLLHGDASEDDLDPGVIFQFPWEQLSHAHLLQIRLRLSEKYALNTANLYLSALRGVLRACWKLGLLTRDEYARRADLDSLTGSVLPKGRSLTKEELSRLFSYLKLLTDPRGCRDGAVLAMLFAGGFRRSELISLMIDDLERLKVDDREGYRVNLQHGKGRKARINFLNPEAAEFVDTWLTIRGNDSGPLITRVDRLPDLQSLNSQSIYDICVSRSQEAGIKTARPHDFRRTMATRLLDSGIDVFRVQRLMGHADISTTQRYDRRHDEGLIQAAFSLAVDFGD